MPKKIETIFTHSMTDGTDGELGIDRNANLYWNKKAVVTKQTIALQRWANGAIVIGATSTLCIAIFTALSYFKCK